MKLDSLKKLWIHELKDLYSAEKQILDAMPRVLNAVSDQDLKTAIQEHAEQTKGQVRRLESIFNQMEFEPGGQHCRGMEGLIEEAKDILSSDADPDVRDAALVAALQRVEHYEIAGYGVTRTIAEKLGEYSASDLLQETLNEEGLADQRLTRLAERKLNFEAMV